MPYIEPDRRPPLDAHIVPLAHEILSPGELDYSIMRLVNHYATPHSFTNFATVVGVLILVTSEFVRRVVNPYEDKKMARNGDVL